MNWRVEIQTTHKGFYAEVFYAADVAALREAVSAAGHKAGVTTAEDLDWVRLVRV